MLDSHGQLLDCPFMTVKGVFDGIRVKCALTARRQLLAEVECGVALRFGGGTWHQTLPGGEHVEKRFEPLAGLR